MKLTEISKEKTPEKFFTAFDDVTQTWLENEVISSPDGIRLRRKAKDGWQDMWISTVDWSLHLFHVWFDEDQIEQAEEVATGQIFMEYLDWDANTWTINPFDSIDVSFVNGNILVSLADSLTNATMTIEQEWKIGSAKQTYRGNYLGQKIRVQCIVKLINPDKPIIDYSDFNLELVGDETRNIAGTNFRYLIFASDGVDDAIEVDPYITLETSSTSATVSCDGFIAICADNSYNNLFYINNSTDTDSWLFPGTNMGDFLGSTDYYLTYDYTRVITVLRDTPTCCQIKVRGRYGSSIGGSTYLKTDGVNDDYGQFIFTFYPDRIAVEYSFSLGGEFVLNLSDSYLMNCDHLNCTSSIFISSKDGTSETSDTTIDSPEGTYKYMGKVGVEYGTQLIPTGRSVFPGTPTADFKQYVYASRVAEFLENGTLPAGDYWFTSMLIIDSFMREGQKELSSTFHWDTSDVDDLPADLTKIGSPINTLGPDGVNYGFECNASGQSIKFATAGNVNLTSGCISFWFKSNADFSDGVPQYLFGAYGTTMVTGDMAVYKSSNNNLTFRFIEEDGTSASVWYDSDDISEAEWTSWGFYQVIWDADGVFTYASTHRASIRLNGRAMYPIGQSITVAWTAPSVSEFLSIGNDYNDDTRPMNGVMYNFVIHDYPFTKMYDETTRLEQGAQYKDQTLTLTSGAAVANVSGLTAIGSAGLQSDGAWHLEMT